MSKEEEKEEKLAVADKEEEKLAVADKEEEKLAVADDFITLLKNKREEKKKKDEEKLKKDNNSLVRNWKNVDDRKSIQAYVGRRNPQVPREILGSDGHYGNPWTIGRDGNREQVIAKYRSFIYSSSDLEAIKLRKDIRKNLKGKVLGCWCSPQACHADIIAQIANVL